MKTAAYAAAVSLLAPFTLERHAPGPHDVAIGILHRCICNSDILGVPPGETPRACEIARVESSLCLRVSNRPREGRSARPLTHAQSHGAVFPSGS